MYMHYTPSKKVEEQLILNFEQGELIAKYKLFYELTPLMKAIVNLYCPNEKGYSPAHLRKVALHGVEAAFKWYIKRDHVRNRSYAFSTYATWWIRQAIHVELGITES